MTINDDLRNKNIKNQVFNLRFRNKMVKDLSGIMRKNENALQTKILSMGNETLTKKRQKKILEWTKKANESLVKAVNIKSEKDFKELINNEVNFQADSIESSFPKEIEISTTKPTVDTILNTAKIRPYEAKKMKQWFDGWSTDNLNIIENTVKSGVIRGQTISQMTRELFGTKSNNYKDGRLQGNRNQLQSVVRTTTNHVINTTKDKFYRANDDIIKGYQWVSTLDSRTTIICINLDGKVDLYDGSKTELNGLVPPAHFGCRSTTTPITKSWRELGIDKEEISMSTRASMNGQVSAKLTYPTWLKQQSTAFQKDVLGPVRYKAWKDGNVEINQFTDNKNNILTIDQLKKKGIEINGGKK
jgi:SPP1 gp7 family putative phage head morphogenesis protein